MKKWKNEVNYYAHSVYIDNKKIFQKLIDHLVSVAKYSSKFAEKFNAKNLGYISGLFHDIGKYTREFQERLEGKKRIIHYILNFVVSVLINPLDKAKNTNLMKG